MLEEVNLKVLQSQQAKKHQKIVKIQDKIVKVKAKLTEISLQEKNLNLQMDHKIKVLNQGKVILVARIQKEGQIVKTLIIKKAGVNLKIKTRILKVVPVKKIIEKARLIIHHQKIKDLDLQKENYQDQVKREKNQGNRRKTSQAQEEKILDLQKENYQDQIKRESNQGPQRKTNLAQEENLKEKILDLQKVKIKIQNQMQNPKVKKARIKKLTKRMVKAVIKIQRDNPQMEMG